MDRATEDCCGTCGWLAKAMMPDQPVERPYTSVFDETESEYREHPCHGFFFIPLGSNGQQKGHLVCFRRAANLPQEAAALNTPSGEAGGPEWSSIIWKDRKCPMWSKWVQGIAPRDQFAEERSRQFTKDLRSIETRLTWLAIVVAIGVGLMLITSDTIGWKLLAWVFRPLGWLRYW